MSRIAGQDYRERIAMQDCRAGLLGRITGKGLLGMIAEQNFRAGLPGRPGLPGHAGLPDKILLIIIAHFEMKISVKNFLYKHLASYYRSVYSYHSYE